MKNTALLLIFLSITSVAFTQNNKNIETFTDTRDGHIYKTIKIGNQIWMAENLAFNVEQGCWAYDDDTSNVKKYGYLYNFETAKTVCPSGWHLPAVEFKTLLNNYGNSKSKANYTALIPGGESGFSASFGGWRGSNGYGSIGEGGYFWSSSTGGDTNAWDLAVDSDFERAYMDSSRKSWGFSVRCIQDSAK